MDKKVLKNNATFTEDSKVNTMNSVTKEETKVSISSGKMKVETTKTQVTSTFPVTEPVVGELDANGVLIPPVKVITGFRHSPDIENFYRFVHENALRREAKLLLERVIEKVYRQKKKKKNKMTH
jgi:hypothetical protein